MRAISHARPANRAMGLVERLWEIQLLLVFEEVLNCRGMAPMITLRHMGHRALCWG